MKWLHHSTLTLHGQNVVDALGRRVDRVRSVSLADNGIHVRILATVNSGETCAVGIPPEGPDVVEFEAFIPGGKLT